MSMYRCFLLLIVCCIYAAESNAQNRFPTPYQPERSYTGQSIFDLAEVAEAKVDIGLWALVLAKAYDPSIDVAAYLSRLDEMTAEIRRMLAYRTHDLDKLLAIKTYLYEPGPWNNGQPFSYDLTDPLGKRPGNQLLSTYLDTRQGNCVSMPTLFLALMERLDPDVPLRGVLAPMHLLVRLHDRQTGDTWNVETTNGGHPTRNQWYIEQHDIPQQALEQGTYLRDLTKREYLAELINVLTRKERFAGHYEAAQAYADLMLVLNPHSVAGLVQSGAIRATIAYETVEAAKGDNRRLTEIEQARLHILSTDSKRLIDQARHLGWQPESAEERARYLQEVEAELARRAAHDRQP